MRFEFIRRLRELSRPATVTEADAALFAANTADVLLRIGPDKLPSYVSPSCTQVFGWTPHEILSAGQFGFVVDRDQLAALDAEQVKSPGTPYLTRFRMQHKDGRLLWVEASARHLPPEPDQVRGDVIIVLRDVTERKRREDELERLALTDGLTTLANRRAFDTELARCWMDELATEGPISLLMLDLDRFKQFNDRYGHQVGDDCLRAVAAALKRVFSDSGAVVARYGGEELTVILPDTGEAAACAAAESARAAIEKLDLPHLDSGPGVVTVSVGVATAMAREGGTVRMPEGLVMAADAMLYRAKSEGRNRVSSTILLAPDSGRMV